jgi:predicted DNA-binding transcriptional regulator AlpA
MKSPKSKRRPPAPRAKMQKVADGEPPAQPTTEPVKFLTKAEVAALFNVTVVTIWKWTTQGVFPKGKQIGAKTMWRADVVAKWQNERPDARVKTVQRL